MKLTQATHGFVDYDIDAVVKVGGSLLSNETLCRGTVKALAGQASKGFRLLVVPGGGPTDNTIESLDAVYKFQPDTHHRACARAQDQTGLMICDESLGSMLSPCETLEEVQSALGAGKVAVLLPSRLIFDLDPFARTWDITSDAIAAYFAWLVTSKQLIMVTNVDGVHLDAAVDDSTKLIERITASELEHLGHTAVDACVAPFLRSKCMNAWVLNGAHADRIGVALRGGTPRGTYIEGS